MAEHPDHHEAADTSRPFLASSEDHQATLMKEVSKKHMSDVSPDEPAPMLPQQVNSIETTSADYENNPHLPELSVATESNLIQDSNKHTPTNSIPDKPEVKYSYPSSRRAIVGITAMLLVLAGFSAIWYNANQDIYTLGQLSDNKDQSNRTTDTASKTKAIQPATLGAEDKTPKTLTLSLSNLPALTHGHYHLWIKQADTFTSLGYFSVNDQGHAISEANEDFSPIIKSATTDSSFLISIESTKNPEQPSSTILLSGAIKESKAKLSFNAIDLTNAAGIFTIAAPTDLSGENQSSGIWFAKTDGQNLTAPGLSIPNAPDGWKYEAQLMYKEQIIAAGRFSNPSDRDDFGVFTPNPDNIPSFPGEDYLQGAPTRLGIDFPANLTSGDWRVIISIEPDQNGSDPTGDDIFYLQPFTANINQGTANYTEQELTLDLSKFPTATIVIE